jgi:hypothetical protein
MKTFQKGEARHPRADPNCECCSGKGWGVFKRGSAGKYPEFKDHSAVQRCDHCNVFRSDVEAAKAAHQVGVYARFEYPCVLLRNLGYPSRINLSLWGAHPLPPPDDNHFETSMDRGTFFWADEKVCWRVHQDMSRDQLDAVAAHAMATFIERMDEIRDRLDTAQLTESQHSVYALEAKFLSYLVEAWGAWAESEKKYRAWRKRYRKRMETMFEAYI